MENTAEIAELAVKLLKKNGLHVATAESCTGGMIAAALCGVAGCSDVLESSFVTYSAGSKQRFCGVGAGTIETYGIVSEQVAYEMASGVVKTACSDVGLAVTGFAGPGGGDEHARVGTVCFGIKLPGRDALTFTKYYEGCGRQTVRENAVRDILSRLCEELRRSGDV
ncbi:MAG: CinA family protein [Clostridia bacterium]|nr:CinA family protein [Clostridia bacterium]